VQRTFGFETAVTEARRATYAANAEAEAARNGIGLVKLMGRDSGFIAAYSALVNNHVNFCLVPEVPFTLEKFLSALRQRLERRSHALIVVAEGAGQHLMAKSQGRDASGNVKYGDIGVFLRDAITDYFKWTGTEVTLKYIDPSYIIRSVPATAHDAAFCLLLRTGRSPRRPQRTHEHGGQFSGITSSRTYPSPSPSPRARRSTLRTHSGAV
jgi:6-phosphofructokinase 1